MSLLNVSVKNGVVWEIHFISSLAMIHFLTFFFYFMIFTKRTYFDPSLISKQTVVGHVVLFMIIYMCYNYKR